METICAPSYANVFMSEFEEKYIYPLIKNKSVIYFFFNCYLAAQQPTLGHYQGGQYPLSMLITVFYITFLTQRLLGVL